ncbi:hypothetical protein V5H42_25800, partial [Salmonella enterica]
LMPGFTCASVNLAGNQYCGSIRTSGDDAKGYLDKGWTEHCIDAWFYVRKCKSGWKSVLRKHPDVGG